MKIIRRLIVLAALALALVLPAASVSAAPHNNLPKPVMIYICGGPGLLLCQFNEFDNIHIGAQVKVCAFGATHECEDGNHWVMVTIGFQGHNGFNEFKKPHDQEKYKGKRIVRLFWAKPVRDRVKGITYGKTVYCIAPFLAEPHGGNRVVFQSCKKKHLIHQIADWVILPIKNGHGLDMIGSVHEINSDPARTHADVMACLFDLTKTGGDAVYTFPESTHRPDLQAWALSPAPVHR